MNMLDFHTHILPGMDDGSASPEESLKMLLAEAEQGVDEIILTPHFYPSREAPESFFARRQQALARLQYAMQRYPNLPRLHAGAEVAYYDGISRSEAAEQLCIGGTGAMLLEMPFCEWTRRMLDDVYELLSQRGIQPVLAHVERYLAFQHRDIVADLCERGVWIQVNASCFTRWQTSRRALGMLERGEIHFLGSDCHNMSSRKPNMGEAAAKIHRKLGEDAKRHLEEMRGWLLGQ